MLVADSRFLSSAFDLLNSSNPVATGFKAPLRPSTLAFQREIMEAASLELMQLRLANERLVTQDGRRMSVIALAFTLKSVSQLAEKLLDADPKTATPQRQRSQRLRQAGSDKTA